MYCTVLYCTSLNPSAAGFQVLYRIYYAEKNIYDWGKRGGGVFFAMGRRSPDPILIVSILGLHIQSS